MIYIDAGCHNGDSIKDFYEGKFFNMQPKGISLSIGIDPLTKFTKEWEGITKEYGTMFINKAAIDYNGEINFSEKQQEVKSSVMKDKRNYYEGKIYKVRCFDFSTFIKNLKGDIIIRMDIEGAEYPVLNKMIKDKTIKKVKFLGVEWHSQKLLNSLFGEQEKVIQKQFKELNINWKEIL